MYIFNGIQQSLLPVVFFTLDVSLFDTDHTVSLFQRQHFFKKTVLKMSSNERVLLKYRTGWKCWLPSISKITFHSSKIMSNVGKLLV